MFEGSLLSILQSDPVITGLVSSYGSGSAVFSDAAPEDAELPFVESLIAENPTGDSIVASFLVTLDFYAQSESSKPARDFCERAIELLDRHEIDGDPRYHKIRLFLSAGPIRVEEGDPRDIHYQVQFSARAGRKRFIDTIVTTDGD